MGNPLFRTKSIERILSDSDAPEHRLKRTLTAWDLTGLGIGAIIGTGIFVLIGTAIVGDTHRPGAGPGIMLSFILSGVTCALAALCYAEFAAMIPVAGSAYTYSYATLGEFLAWLTGWNLFWNMASPVWQWLLDGPDTLIIFSTCAASNFPIGPVTPPARKGVSRIFRRRSSSF